LKSLIHHRSDSRLGHNFSSYSFACSLICDVLETNVPSLSHLLPYFHTAIFRLAHAPSVFPGAYLYDKAAALNFQRRICAEYRKENVKLSFSLFNACPIA